MKYMLARNWRTQETKWLRNSGSSRLEGRRFTHRYGKQFSRNWDVWYIDKASYDKYKHLRNMPANEINSNVHFEDY